MAKGWSTPPSNFAHIVSDDVGTEMKRTAGAMFQAVILKSPVDQGTFRGNHRVSEGSPDNQSDENIKDKAGNETLRIGVAAIAKAKPFTILYIQNNLPYSMALENGHSEQATDGVYTPSFHEVIQSRR
ncbi:hypothetical protein [Moellerella wisconsensis]|uniref:Uncharacterized protein n=1 Tax=Moellerella wisconsensis TaxID=158849 RepID=A0ACD3YAD4_9GAMM|nr:hypothetical protein [Moellerella wisconsensis]UNH39975.1 hypothetical protein MNY70_05900 [Moellerella wisconsensis]